MERFASLAPPGSLDHKIFDRIKRNSMPVNGSTLNRDFLNRGAPSNPTPLLPPAATIVLPPSIIDFDKHLFKITDITTSRFKEQNKIIYRDIVDISWNSMYSSVAEQSQVMLTFWLKPIRDQWQNEEIYDIPRERIIISLFYDNDVDFWTFNAKIVKRSIYSEWENDEGKIEERYCLQHELLSEFKRFFLYYSINPEQGLSQLERAFQLETEILHDEEKKIVLAIQSKNTTTLEEALKKVSSYSSSTGWSGSRSYGYGGHGYGHYNYTPSPPPPASLNDKVWDAATCSYIDPANTNKQLPQKPEQTEQTDHDSETEDQFLAQYGHCWMD